MCNGVSTVPFWTVSSQRVACCTQLCTWQVTVIASDTTAACIGYRLSVFVKCNVYHQWYVVLFHTVCVAVTVYQLKQCQMLAGKKKHFRQEVVDTKTFVSAAQNKKLPVPPLSTLEAEISICCLGRGPKSFFGLWLYCLCIYNSSQTT